MCHCFHYYNEEQVDSALNLGILQHSCQTTHLLTHHMILSWSWHVYTWPSLLLLTTLQHLASSWPTQLLSLALCQRLSPGLQMPTTVLCVFPYISLVTLAINIASVLPVPGVNPNCILSICLSLLPASTFSLELFLLPSFHVLVA